MQVQIIKFSLTDAESAEALPLVMRAIAGDTSVIEQPNLLGMSDLFAPQLPAALPQVAEPPITVQPEHSTAVTGAVKIAPPTGRLDRAGALAWDAKRRRFVRPTPIQQGLAQLQRLNVAIAAFIDSHRILRAVLMGSLIGCSIAALAWQTGLLDKAADYLEARQTAETVEPKPTTIQPAVTEPQTARQGYASSKAGIHGEKPPMQAGALED
jgi:hypothetical protein